MSTINQKFYLVCVRPQDPVLPVRAPAPAASPKMARHITCVKPWHHLQPQQFLPSSQARRICLLHCVRVAAAAAAAAIIMSNILLDAAAAADAARIRQARAASILGKCTQRLIMSPNCLPTCWKSACQTQTQTQKCVWAGEFFSLISICIWSFSCMKIISV